jgi:hypothetical protein
MGMGSKYKWDTTTRELGGKIIKEAIKNNTNDAGGLKWVIWSEDLINNSFKHHKRGMKYA